MVIDGGTPPPHRPLQRYFAGACPSKASAIGHRSGESSRHERGQLFEALRAEPPARSASEEIGLIMRRWQQGKGMVMARSC